MVAARWAGHSWGPQPARWVGHPWGSGAAKWGGHPCGTESVAIYQLPMCK